ACPLFQSATRPASSQLRSDRQRACTQTCQYGDQRRYSVNQRLCTDPWQHISPCSTADCAFTPARSAVVECRPERDELRAGQRCAGPASTRCLHAPGEQPSYYCYSPDEYANGPH